MIKDRILVVDGLNLFTRHYVAHPGMTENGDQIGGMVGFFNNLMRLIERCRPENVYVVWEGGRAKRKTDLYSEYKKGSRPQKLNRYYNDIPDTVQNKNFQMKSLIELLKLTPVNQLYVENSEADDIIGYLCKYKFKQKNKIIVSSDHDYYQLLSKDTLIWSPTLKAFVNCDKVISRFNVHPNNFCLAKCVVGDKSDNIPGVKGVGYKVLTKCLERFSKKDFYEMDDLFSDVKKMAGVSKRKIFGDISASENLIRRNWKLVFLDTQNLTHFQIQKIDKSIENYHITWKNMKAHKLLNELGIKSIDILKCGHLLRQLSAGDC